MIRIHKLALFVAALLAVAVSLGAPATAQMPIAKSEPKAAAPAVRQIPEIAPGTLTRPEIRELMSRLSDDQVRELLLRQLDKSATAETAAPPKSLLTEIEHSGEIARARLIDVLHAAPEVPATMALLGTRLSEAGGVGYALLVLAGLLVAGLAARWLWRRQVHGKQDRIAARSAAAGASSPIGAVGDVFVWLLLELSGVAVYYGVAIVLMFAFFTGEPVMRQFLTTYITALAVILTVAAVLEFILPRDRPAYRLLPLTDAATRKAKVIVLTLTVLSSLGVSTNRLLGLFGAATLPHTLMIMVGATIFLCGLIILFVAMRRDIAATIHSDDETGRSWAGLRRRLARRWHVLASLYAILLWLLAIRQLLLEGEPFAALGRGLAALALFVAVPAIDILAGHLITARYGEDSALTGAFRRTLRVVLVVGAAALFVNLWGFDAARFQAAGVAGWIIGAVVDIGIVALVAYAAWQLAKAYFDNLLAREAGNGGGETDVMEASDGEGGPGATRAATLLPLLRSVTITTIAVMAVLTALARMGVDIAPLLAGAGVVGIAIGFGAQTLVRDVVSGMFFLIDDAFRMGEYIDVGAVKGTVEKISIRSLRLRHHRGPLNTVPFGEIQTLTNYSRDWVIMKLPLRLTYDTDPQVVKKIIKRIGAEMMEDETLSANLLQPPKSQGVLQMEDSAMILRVKFMANPGQQFVLRRELLHRIRAAFAEAGIHFANREVTVRVATDGHDEETVEKAGAAAARAIADQEAAKAAEN